MKKSINLLSDTVTLPTDTMRQAMAQAEVGDDVTNDDPTIKEIQELAAKVTGMEASLFMPSGTMGNLVAIMSHCNAGDEVIVEETAHIVYYECGNMARVAGVMPRMVKGTNGIMNPDQVLGAFRDENIHFPKTTLICVENTHNVGGGTVYPLEYLKQIKEISVEKNVCVHMDGARLFNAAASLNVDVCEITKHVDSVMFCLSKGLSAPVGSMLCGSREFIKKAIRHRKAVGGGLRQSGILAAAGIIAINDMSKRLQEDHKNATLLATNLNINPNITVDLKSVQSNIVYFDVNGNITATKLKESLENKFDIRCSLTNNKRIRMVTNRHISRDDILFVIESVNNILG